MHYAKGLYSSRDSTVTLCASDTKVTSYMRSHRNHVTLCAIYTNVTSRGQLTFFCVSHTPSHSLHPSKRCHAGRRHQFLHPPTSLFTFHAFDACAVHALHSLGWPLQSNFKPETRMQSQRDQSRNRSRFVNICRDLRFVNSDLARVPRLSSPNSRTGSKA